jgi:hypothetical protein
MRGQTWSAEACAAALVSAWEPGDELVVYQRPRGPWRVAWRRAGVFACARACPSAKAAETVHDMASAMLAHARAEWGL